MSIDLGSKNMEERKELQVIKWKLPHLNFLLEKLPRKHPPCFWECPPAVQVTSVARGYISLSFKVAQKIYQVWVGSFLHI